MLKPATFPDERAAPGKISPPTAGLHPLANELDRLSIAERAAKMRRSYQVMAVRARLLRLEMSFGRMHRPRLKLEFDVASNFAPRQGRWGR